MQTKREIKSLLASAGVHPKRRFGQNFLIDGNLMRSLVDAAGLTRDDFVLEVGAGTGALTECLVDLAGRVVSVEIDPALHTIVSQRLGFAENAIVLLTDALAAKHQIARAVSLTLQTARNDFGGRFMLVANLPYNIATPLIVNLLLGSPPIHRFCFTVQREVGDRFLAAPATKAYGPVSILLQCSCSIRRLATLPPHVFWPSPAIESTMMCVDVGESPFETKKQLARFNDLLKAAFAHRRKTLRYNLSALLDKNNSHQRASGFDLSRRPESLSVDEWIELARCVDPRLA